MMTLLRLGLRGIAIFNFFLFLSVGFANPRPINYYFSNGAQLSIQDGVVDFKPSQDTPDVLPYSEKIPAHSLVMVPEGMAQNSKNPQATTLTPLTAQANGPVVMLSPPAQAVPLVWKDQHGANKMAFATQDGKFLEFQEALSKNSDIEAFHPSSLSYHVLSLSDSSYVILANVGRTSDNLGTNRGYPWIINSDGTNKLLKFELPTNFVFTYDAILRRAFFEKIPAKNKLLDVQVDQGGFSHANKNEVPNWVNDKKLRPKLAVVLNQKIEWLSDTQGRIAYIHPDKPISVNGAAISISNTSKPKAREASAMPEVQYEQGRKMGADKVVMEFSKKYELSELADYGFHPEDFRTLAVSLFSNPASSIVVTGEAGGGKTTYVESFIRAVLSGQFADKGVDPSNTEIIRFSAASLTSGTTLRGGEEARADAIVKYAEWAKANGKNVIFFIDEIHTLTMSGTSDHNGNDIFQTFLSPLANGSLKVIGTSTDNGYLQIASRSDLERRLPSLAYKPIEVEDIPYRLEKWMKANNKAPLSQNFLNYLTHVAIEFDSSGEPISRAAKLLSRLYTEASFDGLTVDHLETDPKYVLDVAARFYGYNVQNFTLESLDSKLEEIDEKFSKIVGFDEIKEKIKTFHIRTVTRSRLASKAEGRYLLISPKGLGKTTTVSAVADALGRPFVRIPLSAYNDKEMLYADIARAAKKNPYSVILFDELGDAPREIVAALNSALDAQTISANLNYGKASNRHTKTTIDLGKTLIFAATNTGSSLIEEAYKKAQRTIGFTSPEIEKTGKVEIDIDELKKRAIAEGLLESLLDRFETRAVLYYSQEEFQHILSIHYDSVFSKINKRNHLEVQLDADLKEGFISHLMKKHFSITASPRTAIKELEETIENYFAYLATKERAPKAAELMASSCKTLLSGK